MIDCWLSAVHSGPGFRKMVVSGAEALAMKKAYNPGGK